MRAYQRSSKYQLDSLWLDPIGVRTHHLPHYILRVQYITAHWHVLAWNDPWLFLCHN